MIDISSGFHQGSATPVNQAKVGTISLNVACVAGVERGRLL